jgi:tellurite resistance protein TerC
MQQSPNAEPSEESTYSNAIRNTALAVSAALLFGLGIGVAMGPGKAMEFMTGYVVEESLSVDNLFVFIILFEVKIAIESLPCAKGRED